MIKRLIVASTVAAGLAFAPAAFAEDAMSKPGMAQDSKMDSKMDNKMDKKTDTMSDGKMSNTGGMMDKKDNMSKDGMSKDNMKKN
jgi:pentapeptide MXKDX repeat protein